MFQKVGLPDRGPKTWGELREWGRDLIRLDGKPKAHAFTTAANYNAWYFRGNVWQWGGRYSNEDFRRAGRQGASSRPGVDRNWRCATERGAGLNIGYHKPRYEP
jgi:hypothetical protein